MFSSDGLINHRLTHKHTHTHKHTFYYTWHSVWPRVGRMGASVRRWISSRRHTAMLILSTITIVVTTWINAARNWIFPKSYHICEICEFSVCVCLCDGFIMWKKVSQTVFLYLCISGSVGCAFEKMARVSLWLN